MPDLLFSKLQPNKPVRVEKNGQFICVTRVGDEVFAIEDTCTHADASLSEGDVSGTKIECWLHGAEFDLRTGEALTLPATTGVKTFAVEVNADFIRIDI